MSTPTTTPKETIHLEVSLQQKETLEKAAAIAGLTLSEYLLDLVLNAAVETIFITESIVLSERDWAMVTSAIERPPQLNSRLKAAIERYRSEYEQ
jgi:uncharacterized protein (DUF1778 family)